MSETLRKCPFCGGEAVTELGHKVVSEYVKLPVDADGEVIRVGDTLDYYGETTVVRWLTLGDVGWSMTCENGIWFGFAAFTHHKPTVEDVLREFTDEVWNRCCEGATASDSGIDGLVAECAAKLRELVRDMWHEGMCECGSRGKCASCEYDYPTRMRELGIEVDG